MSILKEDIIKVLDEIRPLILADGGDILFVSFENGIVSLKLLGACTSCPMSYYTLKMGIEQRLKTAFPEIKSVQAID